MISLRDIISDVLWGSHMLGSFWCGIQLNSIPSSLPSYSRVFRTMFKEGQAPSPGRRITSPMQRRRLPTVGSLVSPQSGRKLAQAKSKLQIARRKKSAQELTRSASPDPPAFYFSDDPRNMQIREQVRGRGWVRGRGGGRGGPGEWSASVRGGERVVMRTEGKVECEGVCVKKGSLFSHEQYIPYVAI